MKIETPPFANEAEEATWWFENQDVIADAFAAEQTMNFLLIDKADAELGQVKAAAQGMTYEAYMAQLLHRALHEEAA